MIVIRLFIIILVMHFFTIRKYINVTGCEKVYSQKYIDFCEYDLCFSQKKNYKHGLFGCF
jgi:hypothetical protein